MRPLFVFVLLACSSGGPSLAQEGEDRPFVDYPQSVSRYLKRMQAGDQTHAFDPKKDFQIWQTEARAALIELMGLKAMEKQMATFEPKIQLGEAVDVEGQFTRALGWIETEPGVSIPFYLLIPHLEVAKEKVPLLVTPHGHDTKGFHSYAGAFQDAAHRDQILERGGNIAEQAARRGYVAIAPATRGLANELLVPDPKGRHGKRPCRAQLMHCLVAGRTPQAERVWDMQRLLDWAVTLPQVDPDKIIMTGNSGGGVLTAYTAAIDTRIRVAIPSCSFTALTSDEGYLFHCDCCLVPGLRNWGDWKELGGLVAPRHLLLVHGVHDGLHHRRTVESVAAAVKSIYRKIGAEDRMALKWGSGGHRFYPEFMWPFMEQAFSGLAKAQTPPP